MRLGNLKAHVVAAFLTGECRQVTAILSPSTVLRLTHNTFGGKRDKRDPSVHGRVHLGRPNFAERQIIKRLKKAKGSQYPHVIYKDFKNKKKAG